MSLQCNFIIKGFILDLRQLKILQILLKSAPSALTNYSVLDTEIKGVCKDSHIFYSLDNKWFKFEDVRKIVHEGFERIAQAQ